MNPTDPAAHPIVDAAYRGQDPATVPPMNGRSDRQVADAIRLFLIRGASDMLRGMREGVRRGWGDGWKRDYPDELASKRLGAAYEDLLEALAGYRAMRLGQDVIRARAADVANQAFMLVDPERLRHTNPIFGEDEGERTSIQSDGMR